MIEIASRGSSIPGAVVGMEKTESEAYTFDKLADNG